MLRPKVWCLLAALAGPAATVSGEQGVPPPQVAQADDPLLVTARRYFDSTDYERTVAAVDTALASITARMATDPSARQAAIAAYEMRARARFMLGDQPGASEDFQALLRLSPRFQLSGQVSPRAVNLLETVRKQVIGQVNISVTPQDARIEINGVPLDAVTGPIPLPAGDHGISVQRASYRPLQQSFTVAAGVTQDVTLTLERISASLALVTSPPGVEVIVNGVSRGKTEAAAPGSGVADAAKLQVAPTAISQPFVIVDLPTGAHTVELKRDCYTPSEQRVAIDKFGDFQLEPIKMAPAVASISVKSAVSGGVVLLDDVPRGNAPTVIGDVCEGAHTVEVRSPYGRYVRRLTTRAGDAVTVEGTPRPAFAVLSVSGLPEGLRGGADLRVSIERALSASSSITVFAPAADRAEQALRGVGLSAGWLAFDKLRRPIGEAAANLAPQARQDLSRQLAKALDVQGVASVTVGSGQDRNVVLVSLLAAGSAEPDVIEVKLDSAESVSRALAQLDTPLAHLRTSVGLVAIDVLDAPGPIIARVDRSGPAAAAGLLPGDTIISAGGKPVPSAAAFQTILTALPRDARLVVELRDRAGLAKRAELGTIIAPRAVALTDQTILFNKLLLDLRARLVTSTGTLEEPVVRLNTAVALMRLGNWTDALTELSRTRLSDGPGIAAGTVLFLTGLCHEAMGQFGDAEKAWRDAALHKEAIISDDGPSVAELAAEKLAKRGS